MSPIIVDNASKAFNNEPLFTNLSFTVPSSQMTALIGASGSGKSTLLNCIGMLERLDSGRITVDGRLTHRLNNPAQRKFRRDVLGYMFQNYALSENATIEHNLRIAIAARGHRAVAAADFEGALARVGLGGRGKENVFTLSGGEQQRVALARIILKKPSVILADEPTGALDASNSDMVLSELQQIASEGATVLIATHSEQVVHACDNTISLT